MGVKDKKSFNLKHLVVMALGNIIGSGIFLASGEVIRCQRLHCHVQLAYHIGHTFLLPEKGFEGKPRKAQIQGSRLSVHHHFGSNSDYSSHDYHTPVPGAGSQPHQRFDTNRPDSADLYRSETYKGGPLI